VEASVGASAIVRASDDVIVRSDSEARSRANGRGTAIGLGGSFGTAEAHSTIGSDIDTLVGNNATITSSGGSVTIDAFHNYTTAGSAKSDLDLYGAKARPSRRAARCSPSRSPPRSPIRMPMSAFRWATTRTCPQTRRCRCGALSNNEADAKARGIIVGLIGGFGATAATAGASGDTLVFLDGRVSSANGLTVESRGRNIADAGSESASGGLAAAGNATVAIATVDPTIHAKVRDGGTATTNDIHLTGGASLIRADSIADANASASGISIALGGSAGGSIATCHRHTRGARRDRQRRERRRHRLAHHRGAHNFGAPVSFGANATAESSSGGAIAGSGPMRPRSRTRMSAPVRPTTRASTSAAT
jgi:hypothetical protein